jgi:4-amino-4-deoxy-L-arabinose transferase-like glycosyltransferase
MRIANGWTGLALVLGLAGLLFFSQLNVALLEPQEPRYAQIAREMLISNRWIVPVLNGQPYLDKPPLFYWLIRTSFQVFGVHDWAARLIPALAGVLTVLLGYLWGRAVVNPTAAFWGAVVLCLSARFSYLQRLVTFDSLLGLWITAGLAAGHLALAGSRLRWGFWLLAGFALGFGLLTKGPVALALVLPPLLIWQLLDRRCPRPTVAGWSALIGVCVFVAAPWYAAVMVREPDFGAYFFWRHNVVRFLAPFDHAEPFWFYWPGMLAGMLPWSLLLPGLLLVWSKQTPPSTVQPPAAIGFWLLAALWIILFYSVAGCKRAVYILPALPPLALALGCFLHLRLTDLTCRTCMSRLARWALLLVVTGAGGIVAIAAWNRLLAPTLAAVLGSILLVCLCVCCRSNVATWPTCAAVTFLLLFLGQLILLPPYHRQFSLRDALCPVQAGAASGQVPVLCYPQAWESVRYYLPAAAIKVFAGDQRAQLRSQLQGQPKTWLVVKSAKILDDLLRDWPANVDCRPRLPTGPVTVCEVSARRGPGPRLPVEKQRDPNPAVAGFGSLSWTE